MSFVERLAGAYRARAPYPRITEIEPGMQLDAAYGVQKQLVELLSRQREIAGYKGALTAAAAQRNMGIDRPVTGVLFPLDGHDGGTNVESSAFGRLLIETELSFRLGADVTSALADEDAAASVIAAVAPAIELANLAFESQPAGADLVAANSAFGSFIRGEEVILTDLDGVAVTLYRDDELLYEGVSGEVLGGQLKAVRWLVNSVLELGYPVKAGHILLTGSIGGLQPGQPGDYVADFGAAGLVRFTVS
ncbi:MAG: hypothetical protein QF921_18120 [Pseudomonadales bacterium]|jgi:2-keto-4-pentenoate hydratase|nr:hypothetical protein [Pseudomonadales bacterium]MDP6470459.1 hypothetical protein [Pseudomonadales bacterium]MDP6827761.1 hypothetical protein [Pseudomonadales bacterium]MDP6973403.1 hypothetical protein [Pseudomonadales bacterium]|tara:strand:- start:3119 stop:3865 length:747 start_codon:yes stop_codon:yes gene_type:complete